MGWDLASHEGLPYRYHLPRGYAPHARRYPLVVFLHGSAERGDDTWSHLGNGVHHFEAQPVLTVAPQCPRDDTWGGSWYGGDSRAQRKVAGLVRELGRRRSVDPARVLLVGYSMGAIGLWALLERDRALFAAAVAIAGDLEPESARALLDFPLWAFHGEVDPAVSNAAVRRVAAMAREQPGSAFRYTEFPGVGHDSWRPAFATPELMPWLLAQRRAPLV